eukprot:scaffold14425_cov133-Isochrysis_galbana.AAC.3
MSRLRKAAERNAGVVESADSAPHTEARGRRDHVANSSSTMCTPALMRCSLSRLSNPITLSTYHC